MSVERKTALGVVYSKDHPNPANTEVRDTLRVLNEREDDPVSARLRKKLKSHVFLRSKREGGERVEIAREVVANIVKLAYTNGISMKQAAKDYLEENSLRMQSQGE